MGKWSWSISKKTRSYLQILLWIECYQQKVATTLNLAYYLMCSKSCLWCWTLSLLKSLKFTLRTKTAFFIPTYMSANMFFNLFIYFCINLMSNKVLTIKKAALLNFLHNATGSDYFFIQNVPAKFLCSHLNALDIMYTLWGQNTKFFCFFLLR